MRSIVGRTWLGAGSAHDRGSSLVEYVLLVSMIAIAVIAAVAFFGGNVETKFDQVGSTISRTPNP